MKALAAAALATTLGLASITAMPTPAEARHRGAAVFAGIAGLVIGSALAHRHYRHHHDYGYYGPHPYYHGHGYRYAPAYHYPRYRYVPVHPRTYGAGYGSAHVAWCSTHYRTYNPATNTYFVRRGVPAVCRSPYAY